MHRTDLKVRVGSLLYTGCLQGNVWYMINNILVILLKDTQVEKWKIGHNFGVWLGSLAVLT